MDGYRIWTVCEDRVEQEQQGMNCLRSMWISNYSWTVVYSDVKTEQNSKLATLADQYDITQDLTSEQADALSSRIDDKVISWMLEQAQAINA